MNDNFSTPADYDAARARDSGGGFNWGGLVGQFQSLVGTAGNAYQDFSGAKPPKSQVNTAARATAAKDYTPWLIGGGAILLVLVLVGVLRK